MSITTGVLLFVLVLVGCQRDLFLDSDKVLDSDEMGEVEAGTAGLMFTRAPANNGDILNRVKTLRILIFDGVTGQLVRYASSEGIKVNNQRFPASGVFADNQTIQLNLTTSPGTRNIYFVANEDSDPQLAAALSSNSLTRVQLLGLTASGNPNVVVDGTTPFLMTGNINSFLIRPYSTSELVVELKRSYSKVTVQFSMDNAFATSVVNAPDPSTVVTSPSNNRYYYTKASAAVFVSIDEISIQVPQKYYLFNTDVHANQSFVEKTATSIRTTKSGTWVYGKNQRYRSRSWQAVSNSSRNYSYSTAVQHTAVFYLPEYMARNPLNEEDALKISFKVSRNSFEEPAYPSGTTQSGNYAYSTSSRTFSTPAAISATRIYTTPLSTRYNPGDDPIYSIPRNHEYTVNASLTNWETDALVVKAGVQQWNQEEIDIEMAPVNFDWGYWLNDASVTPFNTPPGQQHAGTARYGQPQYFGIKMVGPIGKPWRVTLSDGYSFEFTDDSQTSGLTTREGGNTYLKFGVMPVFPYESTVPRNTEIRILVDDVIVENGRLSLTQVQ